MRILYVSYMHPAIAPGGAQQVAHDLFLTSRAQGHQAYLLAALDPYHEEVYGKPGAPIVPVPGEDHQYFYFPQYYDYHNLSVGDWRSIQFFREFVERINPDVIHFHHYHRIGVEALRAARLAAPEAVICLTFHEMMAICMADGQMVKTKTRALCRAAGPIACNQCFPEVTPEAFTLRARRLYALLNECDVFTFPSEFVAERYLDWGLPGEKCIVIPNGQAHLAPGIDTTRHSRLLNRFGFFGQLIDNKGVDIVLEALLLLARENRIPDSGIVVEINAGNKHYASAPYIEKVMRLVGELKQLSTGSIEVQDRGAYDRGELAHRMMSIDWVLVPSTWWEIFGLVVSEGWMFGRPVIAASIAGLEERVRNGENGFTFPVRDVSALADLMAGLVGDEARWARAHSGIEQPWSAIDMLQAYETIWDEYRARPGRRIKELTDVSLPMQAARDRIAPIAEDNRSYADKGSYEDKGSYPDKGSYADKGSNEDKGSYEGSETFVRARRSAESTQAFQAKPGRSRRKPSRSEVSTDR